MNTLVIGGAGFICSHLIQELIVSGHELTVLDISKDLIENNLKEISQEGSLKVVTGSIMDEPLITKLMTGVTHCYHLAAALGVEKINKDPIASLEINLKGSQIVLNAAANVGARTLLASSSEIYGKNPNMPLKEDSDRVLGTPEIARWSYSEAKAMDELHAFELYENK